MKLLHFKQIRFIIAGIIGALVNLLLIYFLVEKLKMDTFVMKNYANAISLELSIIFSFIINRNWTWNHRLKYLKYSLLRQCIYFHLAVTISVIFRIIIFPFFQYFNLNYLVNTAIGILLGSIINYFSFDKFVFKINK